MVSNNSLPFYSMLDGKPPMIMWNFGLFEKLPLDPLAAGRLVSIIFGFFTLLGIIEVGRLLGLTKRGQEIACLLYLFNPLLLFFDRMALLDGPISTVFIWTLFLCLKISQDTKYLFKNALLLGLVQGVGLWIKGTAKIFLLLPFIVPLITYVIFRDKKRAFYELKSFILSALIAQIIFLPIRFNSYFQTYSQKESDFLLSFDKLFNPSLWLSNSGDYLVNLMVFISPVVILFFIKGLKDYYHSSLKNSLILSLFFAIPVLGEIIASVYFRNRYFIFTFLPIILLSAIGLDKIKSRVNMILTISLLFPFILSFLLVLNPLTTLKSVSNIPILSEDLSQYYTGWTSGYGVKETADYLKNLSLKEKIVVVVRADSGNPEDAMYVYLGNNKNIILASAIRKPQQEDLLPLGNIPIYFVSRGPQYLDMENMLKEIKIFKKPLGNEFVGIYYLTGPK